MVDATMRHKARKCLERADKLIANGDEDSARYACLELRFAIEYLAHQQLQAYLDELPNEVMKKWTPKELIGQMLTVDPQADQSSIISYSMEEAQGGAPAAMKVLGEDKKFSLKWANKNHNTLGNFLHAPTLYQIETKQMPSVSTMIERAKQIAETVRQILAGSIFNVNMGMFYELECGCGHVIKRRDGSFMKDDGLKCPRCSAIWDVTEEAGKESGSIVSFRERRFSYTCLACNADIQVGVQNLKDGKILECVCGAKSRVEFALTPIAPDPQQGLAADVL